jgi:hypothetical protein
MILIVLAPFFLLAIAIKMNDMPARDGFLFTTEQFRKEMPLGVT